MKYFSFSFPCAVAAVLLALPFSGAHAADPAPIVDPSEWMRALAQDVLQPGYAQLSERSKALSQSIDALCAQPGGAAREAAQARWKEAALVLRGLSPLPFGPALEQRTLRRIDFWPTRPQQIEASIKAAPDSLAALERIGFTAQGFPALEYLLFDNKRKPLEQDEAACRYAALLAQQAVAEIDKLNGTWTDWPLIDEETAAQQQTTLLADGVNTLIGSVDVLRLKFLEKPASAAQPDFDAWRSKESGLHIKAYFGGLQAGLQGGASGVGLTAFLRGRGLLDLSDRLDQSIAKARRSIDALPARLSAADKNAVRAAAGDLAALHTVLSQDVADALKVLVGFGESDGD